MNDGDALTRAEFEGRLATVRDNLTNELMWENGPFLAATLGTDVEDPIVEVLMGEFADTFVMLLNRLPALIWEQHG